LIKGYLLMGKSTQPPPLKEVDIARPVVEHLIGGGWDVYQEVETLYGIADVIALLEKKLWIIEVKNSLSLSLLAQAKRWLGSAHWVSIAIPKRAQGLPNTEARRFAMGLLEDMGIGTFIVNFSNNESGLLSKSLSTPPHMLRRPNIGSLRFIRENLKPQQKYFAAAGSRGGSHWTPYKESCFRIKSFVKINPGCLVKDLVDSLGKLHYGNTSSARNSISAMSRGGHVPGVVARHEDGKLRLYITED